MTEVEPGVVLNATLADLRVRNVDPTVNGMAALAARLAYAIDEEADGKALAALARVQLAAMVEVARTAPAAPAKDDVDDLRARRATRRRGA
jgi:hypothetical protein